ncbi:MULTISPECIES: sensor histidine kinase [unclassified Shinella]|uniref:sensor histidine kinase n=1 Tax=unclassified Shinella TaxID=2643062 RepID=UPI00234F9348|nr:MULTISPECIES: HAMP domain-containing sensor histidine kinase [unclassified Shinella]MCO5149170.1 HAMP domain-containing histidine kinase [Shinella sp.]MDC7265228.1 HAMP domain-containing histidine kinase [Shinella sp. HY16]MDC7272125.1 HAMP domain-containing histidine kinase [Shinella sp. YZ44]
MRGSSFLRSTALKHAAAYMMLFAVANLSANLIAHRMVLNFLDDRLNASVLERFREISSAFDVGGVAAAVTMIKSHGPAIRGEESVYNLRDPGGRLLAGNVKLPQAAKGFSSLNPARSDDGALAYKLYRGDLGDYALTVGVSYKDTDRLTRIVTTSFGWATAISFGLGTGGAILVAGRLRRRVRRLVRVAHAIGNGELALRLPVSRQDDEVDHLAKELNGAIGQLESSVTALKQVTTDIAHDLKTPLGRVFLMLDESLQAQDAESGRAFTSAALSELAGISTTFDALLRIAQIEARDRRTNFRFFDLQTLLADIHDAFRPIAEDDGYILHLECDGAAIVFGDADLIRQLCVNLLTNALRHTPPGTTIEIASHLTSSHVHLVISDNGPGIPDRERGKVFDRFYRLDKSRNSPGTGLGLSLVKAIGELHGGTVALSDNAPGLVCTVRLPSAG